MSVCGTLETDDTSCVVDEWEEGTETNCLEGQARHLIMKDMKSSSLLAEAMEKEPEWMCGMI